MRKDSDKREKILSVAASLIAAGGYTTVTLEDIAAKMKLKKQSLYHYFGSKTEILYQIPYDVVKHMVGNLKQIVELPVDPSEKLQKFIMMHVTEFYKQEAKMKVYAQVVWSELEPKRQRQLRALEKEYEDLFHGILVEGIEAGIFRSDLDIRVIEFAIIGMITHMAKWYSRTGRLPAEDIAENYIKLVLGGLYKGSGKNL